MLEKLKLVEARYLEMAERAAQPDFYNDPKAASQLLKEQRQLEPIITAYRSYRRTQAEQEDLRAMLSEGLEPEMKALCQEEFSENKKKLEALEQELKILLLPRDPNDDKSVIMEIRGGVGGEESALFAHSLYRMYTMYAEAKHWTVTLLNYNETELGGVKEADFEIQGAGAYSRLKFESGVHRVQRVPETESGGRVHTSTATVAVLPEMEQAEVDIRPEDIEMQVYRSSGAGGQHINKTSSAVRLIHKPSGIVVACQEERSQVQNREKCMQMLASKLYQIEQARIESAVTSERRSQVGTGMRNERIRTYNFPQGRVTDHRIGLTLYKIDSIMDGALDELIDAVVTADQAEGCKAAGKHNGFIQDWEEWHMVFWCMMLLFTLMTPAVMIGFGRSFFKRPPRDINATFGYRTTMSMKNQETWKLAHRVCGRYWFICGLILLPLSVLPMLLVINRSTETIGMTGVIAVFAQLVPMLCVIIPTEHALRKNFDKNGNRKEPKSRE